MSPQFYTVIRKTTVWGVLLFLLAVVQTGFFARLALIFPYGAVPDLMLAAVIAIAIFDSERAGAIAGIAAGVIIGALGGTGLNLLPIVYLLCGYVCGIWSTMSLSANFPSWCVYMLAGGIARGIATLVEIAFSYADYDFFAVLRQTLFPEFTATVLLSPLIYLLVRRVALFFNRRLKIPD